MDETIFFMFHKGISDINDGKKMLSTQSKTDCNLTFD